MICLIVQGAQQRLRKKLTCLTVVAPVSGLTRARVRFVHISAYAAIQAGLRKTPVDFCVYNIHEEITKVSVDLLLVKLVIKCSTDCGPCA